MSTCASSNCGYYWKDEDEEYPRCHYPDDGTPAPCELDDDYIEPADIDEDIDFDPYGGCTAWDF